MILSVDKVEKSFGARVLFTGASLQINAGERYALVGPNGAGKTTLLKIVMGLDAPDVGSVLLAKDVRVGYLEQETRLASSTSILEEVMASASEITSLGARAEKLQQAIAAAGEAGGELDALLREYGRVQDRFERLGGYELESGARQILAGLGFRVEDFSRPCAEFSGGWQMRIALAKLFLRHPDLLLLDEPTNHLDLESVQWLRGFIAGYEGAVLIVSHDRVFMDACCDHVAAVENRRVTTYAGNYSAYLRQREENLEQMRLKRAAQEREIAHMQVFVDKFRYKPTKAAQAQERIRRIEQIRRELVILPEGHRHVDFKFPDPPRSGDMVVALENASKAYGDKQIYDGIDLTLYRGDHVVLSGPNGAGKSTLMKMLAGVEPLTGGARELGLHVGVAYYAQHQLEALSEANTVLQEIDAVAPGWTVPQERSLLGAFLFSGDDVDKRVGVLSGGERARLALAKMLVAPEALLCLDEPTNHLDIDSIDMLERALTRFPGTIVLISHDEHLVRAVANRVVDIRENTMTAIDGDYDYFLYKRDDLLARAAARAKGGSEKSSATKGSHPRRSASVPPSAGSAAATGDVRHGRSERAAAPRAHVPAAAKDARSGRRTREQRRKDAEIRAELNQRFRRKRERLKKIDADLARKRGRYDELMALMASEELYGDQTAFNRALAEYGALKKEIPVLEEEWLDISTQLEEAEERACGRP